MRLPAPIAAIALTCLLAGCAGASAGTARVRADDRWQLEEVRTLEDLGPAVAAAPTTARDVYGGRTDANGEAAGFFRVGRLGDAWWLVDPDGHPFLSVGVCTVTPGGAGEAAGGAEPGGGRAQERAAWAATTAFLLREAGFTTLGSWSDERPFRRAGIPIPYAPQWNFMQRYRKERPESYGNACRPGECLPVFDPEFEAFCDRHARQLEKTAEDPWLLGHFSDNELPFTRHALETYLDLPPRDPGGRAAREWWDRRTGGAPRREITWPDRDAFRELLARRYFETVAAAIRRHDPNHLYLGSRLHGQAVAEPVFRASAAVDVVSVNYYHAWTPDLAQTRDWVAWSGRPYLVSEWYAQVDEQGTERSGAGFKVAGERDQQLFYQNFTLALLGDPGCVGWHWFKYSADADGHPYGLVDAAGEPRRGLLDAMRAVNLRAYAISDLLRGPPPRDTPQADPGPEAR